MDPNATLASIDRFLQARQTGDQVDEWCEYLYDWIAKGGFEPRWADYSLGTSYYQCRAVYIKRGERLA